ncbi:MAG: hypothetical protein RSD47_10405 [Romboutsia sp.]
MKFEPQYTRAVIIVHGKSEEHICKYIKSNLKVKIEIYKNNKSSIQITDLNKLINNEIFKNKKSFLKKYDDIEVIKKELTNFKLFIIMDTDDCTNEKKQNYISGAMFKGHWAYDYIVPIYNNENLEDVMEKLGIKIEKDNKREYIKIFPTDRKYKQLKNDLIQVESMSNELKGQKKITNMSTFFDYCLNCTSCLYK